MNFGGGQFGGQECAETPRRCNLFWWPHLSSNYKAFPPLYTAGSLWTSRQARTRVQCSGGLYPCSASTTRYLRAIFVVSKVGDKMSNFQFMNPLSTLRDASFSGTSCRHASRQDARVSSAYAWSPPTTQSAVSGMHFSALTIGSQSERSLLLFCLLRVGHPSVCNRHHPGTTQLSWCPCSLFSRPLK